MNRFSKKILFYVLAIWTISAIYSAVANTHRASTIRFEDKPGLFELLLDTIDSGSGRRLKSKSAILIDLGNGEVIARKNEGKVCSIASLTKLATAIVYLRTAPDFFEVETVTAEDRLGAGRSRLYAGEKLTRFDLFHLMLISSDNAAARVLARASGFSREEFAGKMNELASELGLANTRFIEPTGLDNGNVSTASEMAVLFKAALEYNFITDVISQKNHTYKPIDSDRQYVAYNTNRLLYGRDDIIGGKTGYIRQSGYCLALGVEIDGRDVAAIILGAPSNNYRYRDAARLLAMAGE